MGNTRCYVTLSTIRTPERDALVREMYPTLATVDEIWEALNALPGRPIGRNTVATYAAVLKVYRSAAYKSAMAYRPTSHPVYPSSLPPATLVRTPMPPEEIDQSGALLWGIRNGVGRDLTKINELRQKWGLPPFAIRRRAAA